MGEGSKQSRRGNNQVIYDTERIDASGWPARVATLAEIRHTYPWIGEQVLAARAGRGREARCCWCRMAISGRGSGWFGRR